MSNTNIYATISLTGGADGALDAINGSDLNEADASICFSKDYTYIHYLDEDSGAVENSPFIIKPDNNAEDKRWILSGLYAHKLHLRYGTSINEFSTDGSFAGNSDDAVPTEKAIKTFFDTSFGDYYSITEIDELLTTFSGIKIESVVEDTSPQLGGDLEYNEHNQVFDITLTSDNTAAGDIITVTYGETVSFGQPVYPDKTDNEWKLGYATNEATTYPSMGIALEAKNNGESGKMLLRGTIRDATYFSTATMGDIVYLSDTTPGNYIFDQTTTSGSIVQILGFAIANNYIFFNPSPIFIEVG